MSERDEIATVNRRHWEWAVKKEAGCTIPCLDLDLALIRRYARGEPALVQEVGEIFPASVLADVEGKDILCLAAGGGQQSAVFGLLGARVTVVDLAEGQLEGDRKAAAHYGYEVTTIRADMRDLSFLEDESYDIVYGTGMCFIPNVREVYSGVARILRSGGMYRVDFSNPATEFVDWDSWDKGGYRITMPYAETERVERFEPDGENSMQFRHHMGDIFNGLLAVGLSVRQVQDSPYYFQQNAEVPPGSWYHWLTYVGSFAIVADKE